MTRLRSGREVSAEELWTEGNRCWSGDIPRTAPRLTQSFMDSLVQAGKMVVHCERAGFVVQDDRFAVAKQGGTHSH